MRFIHIVICIAIGIWGAASLIGCSEPRVNAVFDASNLSLVSGSVIVDAAAEPACGRSEYDGPVVLLLISTSTPSGLPRISVVGRDTLFGGTVDATSPALLTGRYDFSDVVPGTYQIRAILDGDRNFNPFVNELAQPTSGDLVGAHVDANNATLTVEVGAARTFAQTQVRIGLPVPVEPPAFQIVTTNVSAGAGGGQMILETQALPDLGFRSECLIFVVRVVEEESAFDLNNDGLTVYPTVTLTPIDGGNSIPAEIDITSLGDQTTAMVTSLTVQLPENLNSGTYSVRLDTGLGQNWTVPNGLNLLSEGVPASQQTPLTVR